MQRPPSIEFFSIGLAASFHLSIDLWASRRDVEVRDAQIGKTPCEVRSEWRAVVCMDLLDGKGEMPSELAQELHCGPGIVVIVNVQNAEERGLFAGREPVEALARWANPWNEFHIELDGAPRSPERRVDWLGACVTLFHGDWPRMKVMKKFQNGRW